MPPNISGAWPIFQFQLGTIASRAASGRVIRVKNFNSSLVRLRETDPENPVTTHEISIPAWYDCERRCYALFCLREPFQFQLGTIARQIDPEKVGAVTVFQFQLGTIARPTEAGLLFFACLISIPAWYDCEQALFGAKWMPTFISIPAWYDCESSAILVNPILKEFQFQLGTIARIPFFCMVQIF